MSDTDRPRRAPSPETLSGGNSTLHLQPETENEKKLDSFGARPPPHRPDGKVELTENMAYECLGFCFPFWKKWSILAIIFSIQVAMNANASIYANAVSRMAAEWSVSIPAMRVGQCLFLIFYGFGCELWAAPSEEFGRWPILQASLLLTNIWLIPQALAPSYGVMITSRVFCGLSQAGGSVTLGMVADMWEPEDQQYAMNFVVLSSVGGAVVGPIVGGFLETFLHWRWVFWFCLILGGTVQILHFIFVPETRVSVLLDREAKRRRKSGEDPNIYGPGELKATRLDLHEMVTIMTRPFVMFVKEPIVLFLSLLSGFSDALIFTCLESFALVFDQYGFSTIAKGLTFCAFAVTYLLAYGIHTIDISRQRKLRARKPDTKPEDRMWILLWIVPLLVIGLFGFAWTSLGPEYTPWIAPLLFAGVIGLANYSVYQTTIDYMVAAYGPFSASACGGNGLARDVLAGVSAMYAHPLYTAVPGRYTLQWGSTILGFISILVVIPPFIFYYHGDYFRGRSKFAQAIAQERKQNNTYNPSKKQEAKIQHVENTA